MMLKKKGLPLALSFDRVRQIDNPVRIRCGREVVRHESHACKMVGWSSKMGAKCLRKIGKP
jgi:hypothetical protein